MDFELAPESALEPSRTYGSFEEVLASARKTAVIHRRDANKERASKLLFVYAVQRDTAIYSPGETGTHPSKKRRTKTRKVSCPFRLLIARDGGSRWSIHHSANEAAREHSHEPDSFGTFPADRGDIVRRHSAFIIAQWNARVKICQILSDLRQSGTQGTRMSGASGVQICRTISQLTIGVFSGAEPRFNELSIHFVIIRPLSQDIGLMKMTEFSASSSRLEAALSYGRRTVNSVISASLLG
ncbi:hypothetical protein E4U51_001087 [Claviceps purpurea]|nr:hypothetical protein E4U51_001087 [Claviceps purpurea]